MKSLSLMALVSAGCGNASYSPPSSSDALAGEFMGTWSCPTDAGAVQLSTIATIIVSENELTETLSFTIPSAGPVSCIEVYAVSGSTATLNASQTTCTGPGASSLTGKPSSETETVSGNTLTVTGVDTGSGPFTGTCTRQ